MGKSAMKAKKGGMKKTAMKKKAMKAKRVSKVAKGRGAKARVFRGAKEKTASGLKKSDLTKNKNGKVVSKKKSAAGKKNFKRISGWLNATAKARKALNIKGFCPVGGKTAKGKAFLAKARSFYKKK